MNKSPKIAIIYNSLKNKNSKKVAKKIFNKIENCAVLTANNKKNLHIFDFIFFIIPNIGDEELPEPFESYLLSINIKSKKYFICELGNYFGLDYNGCKKIATSILDKLKWRLMSDLSLDSAPEVDDKELKKWICICQTIIKNEYNSNNSR